MFKNQNAVGGKKEKQWWLAYFLLLPSFVLFAIFSYYPLIKTVVNSFAVTDQVGRFIKWAGFSNWQRILGDTNFGSIMAQTFVFAILNLVMTFFPAMFLALLSAKKGKGSKLYQTLYAYTVQYTYFDEWIGLIDEFVDNIRNGKTPLINLKWHKKTIEAMNAVYESIATGQPVKFD